MDDLFDFGARDSGQDATAQSAEGQAVSAQAQSAPAPAQYGSRREARAAGSSPAVSRKQERAASRRSTLSRPATDRRAVSRASREIDADQPASRKLRRAEIAAMHAAAPSGPRRNPFRALATMTIVGGLFAVAGLPAYALTGANTVADKQDVVDAQSMVVSADAALGVATRDGYRATTSAQLEEMSKDDVRSQNNADYLLSGARQLGDDYPWYYELSEDQGATLSPLNYYYRQCTDFVAWRLNRDAGSFAAPFKFVWSNLTPTGGNASQWEYAWEQQGWPVSKTPIVGSVAWFGWSNHVAYVKAVNPDGTIVVEEYNYVPNVYGQRTIPASSVDSFLYPPT